MVWAHSRNSTFSEKFSLQLVKFLATQSYEGALNADTSRPMYLGASAVTLPPAPARSLPITASDWGFVGLMQTPTARMSPVGDARFNLSRAYPYERINVFVQPFEWLEAGFRYTNVSNRLYGPLELSGTQAYKATMLSDGNLILTDKNFSQTFWSTGTSGNTGAILLVQDDGNLVIKTISGALVWSSNSKSNCTGYNFLL
jgi:hypothetical protein